MKTLTALTLAGALALPLAAHAEDMYTAYGNMVDDEGNISLPDLPHRQQWAVLGTWMVNGDEGKVAGAHQVYTQPGVIEAYLETGEFPDGTVLVKELLETTDGDYTTGNVSYATELSGYFVMVKDAEGRFPDNKLWGNGWGWAYFDAEGGETPTEDYEAECLGCHVPAEENDWIYIEGYPPLHN